jgi:hypothetical protein
MNSVGLQKIYPLDEATYTFTHSVLQALNTRIHVVGKFCVLPKLLIVSIIGRNSQNGLDGKAGKWFESYLTNRRQRVATKSDIHDNTCLKWDKVQQQVSQGFILGPLLFLMHINDLPPNLKTVPFHNDY